MGENGKMTAVITGAGSGIGKAIAVALAESGVSVYLVGRNIKQLDTLSRKLKLLSSKVKYYQADLSLASDLEKLSRKIGRDLEKVDILIHSAGFMTRSRFEDSFMTDFDRHFSVNVRAPYYLTRKLLPLLRQARGQIVFINSSVALKPASGELSQYIMSKYALRAFADSLRDEVNSAGIRVITVYPGRTATPMQKKIHKQEGKQYNPKGLLQPEDIAETVMNALVLPRTAEVTDVSIRPFVKQVS